MPDKLQLLYEKTARSHYEITAAELSACGQSGLTWLDVRNASEWADFHVNGAINIPLIQLQLQADYALSPANLIIVYCNSGNRSSIAAKILRDKGFRALTLTGGLNALYHDRQF